ncbi:signal peptide peptidase SppA [Vibrio sp. SS-MA-C1-2]|uniref:signal peptide peptidase SppA n=1 Tax=Vibrio sp. SS-MA-C1-2 TaxID=2908646 RepID=UPI001F43711F|nr:signal peptide peptidase SppA [Vibrio sp. SS-MA-C1-2]UJF19855.1 signal peptide peptidase SppA [Vibrio sp. SS-MA-C1-2]
MKKLFRGIGWILKCIWGVINFSRKLILNLVFFSFLAVVLYMLTSEVETPSLPAKSALVVKISGPLVEQASIKDPTTEISNSLLGKPERKEVVISDLISTLRHAKDDPNITGLVLSLSKMPRTSISKLSYVAQAVNEFKESGKPVYAVADNYSQSQYYLASYADQILMNKGGAILLEGYGSYRLYYKTLLDKLDVTTHVFRVGTYKSFVEPFIRDDMSAPAKEATLNWLNQLWQSYLQTVAKNRNITPDTLSPEVDTLLSNLKEANGSFADMSLKLGLVDQLATRNEMTSTLAKAFGYQDNHSFKQVSYSQYYAAIKPTLIKPQADKIAVVAVSGAIVDGPTQQPGNAGGDTVASLLRQARLDKNVKAVILRVDSPGGSAFASEIIRNEVTALQAAGKPVIASMSSVAASGGYWVSVSADKIIAQPTTITGSIGIFGLFASFENILTDVGVTSDGVGTTPFAGLSVTRALPEQVGDVIQLSVENGYQRFIGLVSQYRHMSLADADKIAQGRVWTGKDAKRLGLVDQLGNFDDAITSAAALAKVDTYQVEWMKKPLTPLEEVMQEFNQSASSFIGQNIDIQLPSIFAPAIKAASNEHSFWQSFNDPKGQYTLCLNCVN